MYRSLAFLTGSLILGVIPAFADLVPYVGVAASATTDGDQSVKQHYGSPVDTYGNPGPDKTSTSGPVSYSIGPLDVAGGGDYLQVGASASADWGLLHASASGSLEADPGANWPSYRDIAAAFSFDTWGITAPGVSGTGTLEIGYDVQGTWSAQTGGHQSGGSAWRILASSQPGNWGEGYDSVQLANGLSDAQVAWYCCGWGAPYSGYITLPITFGQTNYIEIYLDVAANGFGYVPWGPEYEGYTSAANFTANISGFEIFDSSGQQVTDGTVVTGSGHSYSAASVPEPAGVVLLLTMLALIAPLLKSWGSACSPGALTNPR